MSDLDDSLFAHRTIALVGPLDEERFARVFREMLVLDDDLPGEPIRLWINSGGGSVYELLALIDQIRLLPSPVETIAVGAAFSAAAVLLAAGAPGRRFCTPNVTVMLHRSELSVTPSRGSELASLGSHYEELDRKIVRMLAEITGRAERQIVSDRDCGLWLDAEAAVAYGLADRVLIGGDPWT